MKGSRYSRITGGPDSFYEKYTTTNAYVARVFGGNVNTITVSNDSTTDDIQVSFDGTTLKAEIYSGETLTLYTNTQSSVYIKATAGGGTVRIWGW